jgi:zinc protease
VFEERIATEVAAVQHSRELGGFFEIVATAVPGISLAAIEDHVREELDRFAREGPDRDELAQAMALTETNFVSRLEQVGGFGGKSDQLNGYNVFRRDPGFFGRDLERYRAVTVESVREAVRRWLAYEHAVTLSVVPQGRLDLAVPGSHMVVAS